MARTLRVSYNEEQGVWRVAGPTAGFGTFKDKTQAVQEAKRIESNQDKYTGVEVETKSGGVITGKSTGSAEGVDEKTSETAETKRGKFQRFATTFADGVNNKVRAATETTEDDTEETTNLFGGGGSGDLELPFGGGGGNEVSLPFAQNDTDNDEVSMPGFEGGGDVSMPGFGMDGDGNEPTIPGFGMEESDDENDPFRFF